MNFLFSPFTQTQKPYVSAKECLASFQCDYACKEDFLKTKTSHTDFLVSFYSQVSVFPYGYITCHTHTVKIVSVFSFLSINVSTKTAYASPKEWFASFQCDYVTLKGFLNKNFSHIQFFLFLSIPKYLCFHTGKMDMVILNGLTTGNVF